MTVPDFPTKIRQTAHDRFHVAIDGDWSIGEYLNAGYLQHVAARAAMQVSRHPHPLAVTTDFLRTVTAGPAELIVDHLLAGPHTDSVRVTMVQNDAAVLVSSVAASVLEHKTADVDMASHVDLPTPERCPRIESDTLLDGRLGILNRVEVRLAPECVPVIRGQADSSLAVRGWVRLADGGEPSPLSCLVAVDAFPPVTYTLGRYGWAPTVQLTTYLRAVPKPGWLRGELRGRVLSSGWLDSECTLRDSDGCVVAQAHQIVRMPKPVKAKR